MSAWIAVEDEKKPDFHPDDDRISVAVLLYVPLFAQRGDGDSGIRMGRYLKSRGLFRPDGSTGFESSVTHWMPLPIPPQTSSAPIVPSADSASNSEKSSSDNGL